MTAQTANTGAPSGAAAGVPNYPTNKIVADDGACFAASAAPSSTLMISSSAGSGVMTGTFTLWGYLAATGVWYPIKVNGGAAIAELTTPGDTIRYSERFLDLGHYDRLALELAAVGGTATAFEAWLVTARTVSF